MNTCIRFLCNLVVFRLPITRVNYHHFCVTIVCNLYITICVVLAHLLGLVYKVFISNLGDTLCVEHGWERHAILLNNSSKEQHIWWTIPNSCWVMTLHYDQLYLITETALWFEDSQMDVTHGKYTQLHIHKTCYPAWIADNRRAL